MNKTWINSLLLGSSVFVLSSPSFAHLDLSLLENPNHKIKILAAKDLGRTLKLKKPNYSLVHGWEGNTLIEISDRDRRLYSLQGDGHVASLRLDDYRYYS